MQMKPLQMPASLVVAHLRDCYNNEGEAAAFTLRDRIGLAVTDEQLIKLVTGKATLTGTTAALVYEEPCAS
jgi:hypothetical protein